MVSLPVESSILKAADQRKQHRTPVRRLKKLQINQVKIAIERAKKIACAYYALGIRNIVLPILIEPIIARSYNNAIPFFWTEPN